MKIPLHAKRRGELGVSFWVVLILIVIVLIVIAFVVVPMIQAIKRISKQQPKDPDGQIQIGERFPDGQGHMGTVVQVWGVAPDAEPQAGTLMFATNLLAYTPTNLTWTGTMSNLTAELRRQGWTLEAGSNAYVCTGAAASNALAQAQANPEAQAIGSADWLQVTQAGALGGNETAIYSLALGDNWADSATTLEIMSDYWDGQYPPPPGVTPNGLFLPLAAVPTNNAAVFYNVKLSAEPKPQ